jgi:hypothetical protein
MLVSQALSMGAQPGFFAPQPWRGQGMEKRALQRARGLVGGPSPDQTLPVPGTCCSPRVDWVCGGPGAERGAQRIAQRSPAHAVRHGLHRPTSAKATGDIRSVLASHFSSHIFGRDSGLPPRQRHRAWVVARSAGKKRH